MSSAHAASAPRTGGPAPARESGTDPHDSRYKWIALSNTTLGVLMVTINQSIVLIALPNIFDGIKLNPLLANNTSYLLWMMMGFMVATAVLVVSFGRFGDMFGRVRMYNLGFAVFSICSVLLSVTWMHGTTAALWLIGWRVAQGIGGALLFANSTAILTDAFPLNQRGTALGINALAAIAGSFIGLILGGVLGPQNWHFVFLVSVPFGIFGTFWAYIKLRDTGTRQRAKMDWWGNITFGVGLIAVLIGITYGIQPYKTHTMGWTNPTVLGELGGGVLLLIIFVIIETQVAEPLFRLSLFRIRPFTAGNIASLLTALGRGGLQFMLIIWLQGIWLPQHGYNFKDTPLWAGIYLIPLTVGFLVSAPVSGFLSDRVGPKAFTIGGTLIAALSFGLLLILPVNFSYWAFALILVVSGLGSGLFVSPNRAEMMNALPANQRGVGSGMIATFQNSAMVLSIGIFFSLMVAGLANTLPHSLMSGLVAQGVPSSAAAKVAALPPIGVLFAAFLGYNPMQQLLGPSLSRLPASHAAYLTGRSFFPQLITHPFQSGLTLAFWFAIIACVIASIASAVTGRPRTAPGAPRETVGEELAQDVGAITEPPPEEPVAEPTDEAQPGMYPITGTVRDEHGVPVAGATVTVADPEGRQLGRTWTSTSGDYAVPGFVAGSYVVIAAATNREPSASLVSVGLNGASPCHFSLPSSMSPATGEIYGVITSPQGVPLAGITAIVTDDTGEVTARTVSASDGSYQIGGLADGQYTVIASGHRPVTTTLSLAAGDSTSACLRLGDTAS